MRHDPHLLVEGCLIAGFAMRAQRGLHLRARRVLQRSADPDRGDQGGLRRRPARQERLRLGLGLRPLRPSRRRRLYLRRGDRAARKPRGQEGHAAAEAAVPGRLGPLRLPVDGEQRRIDRRRADHPAPRRRLVRRHRPAQQHRHQALLHLRAREQAVQRRGGDGHPAARADRPPLRRRARRLGQPSGGDPGRRLGAAAAQVDLRHRPDGFRLAARPEVGPRHRGRHRHGQVDRHREGDRAAVANSTSTRAAASARRAARAPAGCGA